MQTIIISLNDSSQRLDKFLKKLLSNASMGLIYKLNRKGNIKINKKKKAIDYILQQDDEVKIFVSDEDYTEFTYKQIKNTQHPPQHISKKHIIYEDADLIIINKDAGIIVHPGDFKSTDLSLIELVQDYLGEQDWGLTFKPSLVHRIDKETSGIVLIAKQKQLLTQLMSDFKNHKNIKKTYHVLVFGKMSRKTGTIKKNLLRIENAHNENKVQVSNAGQTAITHYKLINSYVLNTGKQNLTISELEVEIETGRMHQIRVHFANIGAPIIGDSKYGDKGMNAYVQKHFGIQRQLLHAQKIEFYNSIQKQHMSFQAPLKNDIQGFIKKLEKIL